MRSPDKENVERKDEQMKDVVKQDVKKRPATRPGTKHRRRRNLSLYYLLIFIVCVLVLFILSRTVLFNINEYIVSGTLRYTEEQILDAGNLRVGRNMYNLKLEAVEKRIKDKLIYVEDVTLMRKLPDKLIVTVTEAVPYACCEYDNGRYCVISRGGRYLETEQLSKRDDLIMITGMELTGVALGEEFASKDENKELIILELLKSTYELCPDKITYIDITDRTNIRIGYDGRIDVEFGSSLDYEYKLKYIVTIIEENLKPEDTGTLIYHSAQAGASFIKSDDLAKMESDFEAANQAREEALQTPDTNEQEN